MLPAVHFSCLLWDRGTCFQDGVAEGEGCVLRFDVSRSVITVQREFRAWFKKVTPYKNNVTRWYRQFVETGCMCKGGVLVDLMCLMTTVKECVKCFSEVPASPWLEQAGNLACQKLQ
jgi:hypothetical protein